MKNKLLLEELKTMRMIMGYNRSKTLKENLDMLSEITGAGATPPDGTAPAAAPPASNSPSGSSTAPTIPSELTNSDGVKKFQDWLDTNKAGWATGYSGGKLNKAGGYGRFGPRTSKAWSSYKTEYLGGDLNSGDDLVDTDDIQGQPTQQPAGQTTQQPAGQTTQQPAGQTTQQPAGQTTVDVADVTVPKGAPVAPKQDELPD